MSVNLDSEFEAAEKTVAQAGEALKNRTERQLEDDRSLIAKSIIFVFVGLIVWVVLAVSVGVAFMSWDAISEPAKFMIAILSSVMLPVVTLVIGYYFGSR